ncbi:Retrovirus-related Pol polyprotein from transposon TNT 1-94 [Cucumis melo var. makuwa]|uniref:Retrovirus-related Pol polyprotein from transposon TNT 1-94 n=1 Tax=Cucumis melo var. makuwa TaxID=1194695 RepID=A0A5D3CR45_CUCMM|nr:Retrovirus-related Pol polyprotein from transposon TNT 1-94 [Cucumis melo var. makuwa]TYK14251.1 Retrovirus-related Pol polyprotein from transposon TNT 1-94 [Cucumis melo var. makuwa]
MGSNDNAMITQPLIPIFKGEDYEFWSIRMKTLIRSQDLWDLVEQGYANSDDKDCCSNNVKASVADFAKGVSRRFKVLVVKLQSLRRDFETLMMKNGESIADFLSRATTIIIQMRTYGETITDETIVKKVLRSLTPKFDHVVAAIEESKDLSTFTFIELMGYLQAHESRINRLMERNKQKVFQVKDSVLKYGNESKSETFEKFKHFKAKVEKQSGMFIKSLRCDRGGEFLSNFCEEHGIHKELTTPYTPEKNGIVERKNRTVVEMARSMLQAVMNKTPFEAWYGKKPNTPTSTPLSSAPSIPQSYHSSSSHNEISGELPSQKFRSMEDIYNSSQFALMVFNLVCYNEATSKEEWQQAMKEEIWYREAQSSSCGKRICAAIWFATFLSWCQIDGGIFISQKKYAKDPLKKFGMLNCKSATTPMNLNEKPQQNDGAEMANAQRFRSLIGGLIYLTHTRSDISYFIEVIFRIIQRPSRDHIGAAKRVMRYIVGMMEYGICSKKQVTVALSSSEAEYVAATSAACQAIWLQRTLTELQHEQEGATVIFCDNKVAISMTKNPMFHSRTKHIEIRFHFIRELIAKEEFSLSYRSTHEQWVDVLTKALSKEKFCYFRAMMDISKFELRGSIEA